MNLFLNEPSTSYHTLIYVLYNATFSLCVPKFFSQGCEQACQTGVPLETNFFITISPMVALKILLLARRPEGLIFCRPDPRKWILCKPARQVGSILVTCEVVPLENGKRDVYATLVSGQEIGKITIVNRTTWKDVWVQVKKRADRMNLIGQANMHGPAGWPVDREARLAQEGWLRDPNTI